VRLKFQEWLNLLGKKVLKFYRIKTGKIGIKK